MKRVLKIAVAGLSAVLALVVAAALVLYVVGGRRLHRVHDVPSDAVAVRTDEATIARGRHLAEAVTLCVGCHGDDLGGDVLVDEPLIATIYASNLTSGRGGVGATYTDADYVRAIRHGVNREGRGLMIMHSDAYHNLSEADLAAIISYVKSVPPVDHEVPATKGGPLGRVFVALGMFDRGPMPLIPAEVIDHGAPLSDSPPEGDTAGYGAYLVSIALCRMCHGPDLKGGPPIDEGAPPAPNIAVRAAPSQWSEEQFVGTIRTGITPEGKALNAEAMPWEVYGKMTDEELRAIWRYVESLAVR